MFVKIDPKNIINRKHSPHKPWHIALCWFGLLGFAVAAHAKSGTHTTSQVDIGRRIYMEGISASGKPVLAQRANVGQIEGASAACETCHRRSGMGSLEGNIVVPPISGRFLFAKAEDRPIALVDARAPKNITRAHAPYSLKSLSQAVNKGNRVDGQPLNPLMPHYNLSNSEMNALMAYLKQLSAALSPGVGKDSLDFATIITPDVEPGKRDAMIGMMRAAFSQRNASQENYSGRMRMPMDLIPRQLRNWQLKVWELKGAPDTWQKQLAGFYAKEPVFAVISGMSNSTWMPVHEFCQQQKIPCMLPTVPLPPDRNDFYSLYYSRGVMLEADVLAKQLRDSHSDKAQRLIQVYRDNEPGKSATQAEESAVKGTGIKVENRILPPEADLAATLKDATKDDAVMLWLSPSDITALAKAMPALSARTFLSGRMMEENVQAIPQSWRNDIRVIYPYELGANRQKNNQALKHWLDTWQLPLVNEAFQSEVFFNLLYLTDMVSQMVDNLHRDYMIERAEDMLSIGSNVSAYPHLSLGRGQRFASKGVYIARIGEDGKLVADSEWIVP